MDSVATKIIATGNPRLDNYLRFGFRCLIFLLVCDVVHLIGTAYINDAKEKRKRPGAASRKRKSYWFLALGFVALYIVNGVKSDHHDFAIASWDELKEQIYQTKDITEAAGADQLPPLSEGQYRAIPKRDYLEPQKQVEMLQQRAADIYEAVVTLIESDKDIPDKLSTAIREVYRYFHANTYREGNIWDNFKILAYTWRRVWWTQQWFTGYMAWASFVAVKCYQRQIRATAVPSFTFLGYIIGLSSAQCFFYALILLKPRVNRLNSTLPRPGFTFIPTAIEAVAVAMLNFVLFSETCAYRPWVFHTLQATLILIPPVSQSLVVLLPQFTMYLRGDDRTARRLAFIQYFLACSPISFAVHAFTGINVAFEAGLGPKIAWPLGIRWRTDEPRPAGRLTHTWRDQLNAMGDHDLVSACGFDVLLSVFALCCWAVADELNPRSMVKCSLYPWLKEPGDGYDDIGKIDAIKVPWAKSSARPPKDRDAAFQGFFSKVKRSIRGGKAEDSSSEEELRTVRRGRPRKEGAFTPAAPTLRKGIRYSSTRLRERSLTRMRDESAQEKDYGMLDVAGPAEQAGITWVWFVAGGLGVASVAVFGSGQMQ